MIASIPIAKAGSSIFANAIKYLKNNCFTYGNSFLTIIFNKYACCLHCKSAKKYLFVLGFAITLATLPF